MNTFKCIILNSLLFLLIVKQMKRHKIKFIRKFIIRNDKVFGRNTLKH